MPLPVRRGKRPAGGLRGPSRGACSLTSLDPPVSAYCCSLLLLHGPGLARLTVRSPCPLRFSPPACTHESLPAATASFAKREHDTPRPSGFTATRLPTRSSTQQVASESALDFEAKKKKKKFHLPCVYRPHPTAPRRGFLSSTAERAEWGKLRGDSRPKHRSLRPTRSLHVH